MTPSRRSPQSSSSSGHSRPTRRSRLALVGVLLVLFVAVVPAVAAAETRVGGSVVVGANETVDGLEAIGGDVTVLGTVDGNLTGVSGSVTVVGNVTGSVQVASGSLRIEGTVGGDVKAGAGSVTLARSGVVGGDFEAGAGTVILAGTIDGNARVGADVITVRSTAAIAGDLEYDGDLRRQAGARIDGSVTRNPDLDVGGFWAAGPFPRVGAALFSAYFFLVNLAMGAVLLLLFPRFADRLSSSSLDRPGRTSLAGIVTFLGVPAVLVLLALTIVGIPFSILGVAVYALGIWLGTIYGRLVVGVWLLSLVDRGGRWLGFIVGMIAMEFIRRIPFVGGILDLFVLILGLGALALGIYGGYRGRRNREAPAQRTIDDYEDRGEAGAATD